MHKSNTESPRIYNLFPRLIGSIDQWMGHVSRIHDMNFNWIYVNPVNYSGFSGSLYSIKDYFKLNPRFAPPNAEDPYSFEPLKEFIEHCHEMGIKFMMDLVINHTAIDSPLLEEHPKWYIKKWALVDSLTHTPIHFYENTDTLDDQTASNQSGTEYEWRIANPYAIDPKDSRKETIWGDLAEINYRNNSDYDALLEYWCQYLKFCVELGVDGFRCDAAYQVPKEVWMFLIKFAKELNPDMLFLAETLGCSLIQCEDTAEAGFDYIHSSSKWWDFTQPWALEQYNEYRVNAPSVSFPENHDTPRLAKESNDRIDYQIFRYVFASFFSAGVLMPLGYEYGFHKKLDVVDMEPKDWESPRFDISHEISLINQFKQQYACLNEDGELIQFEHKDLNIMVLRKSSLDDTQQILMIYNKNWNDKVHIYLADINYYLVLNSPIYKISIKLEPELIQNKIFEKDLNPNEFILFYQEKEN